MLELIILRDVHFRSYNGDASWELPMPGIFLIDQSGTIHLAFVDPDYTYRLDPSTLLERLTDLTDECTSDEAQATPLKG